RQTLAPPPVRRRRRSSRCASNPRAPCPINWARTPSYAAFRQPRHLLQSRASPHRPASAAAIAAAYPSSRSRNDDAPDHAAIATTLPPDAPPLLRLILWSSDAPKPFPDVAEEPPPLLAIERRLPDLPEPARPPSNMELRMVGLREHQKGEDGGDYFFDGYGDYI
ncbi:hypothetical protein EJB05_50177, partial [Eragrostis curvula]